MKIIPDEKGYRIIFNDGTRISRVFSGETDAEIYIARRQQIVRDFAKVRANEEKYLKESRWFEFEPE